jgi:type I restriction enzyme S subunit
MKDSGIEWIGQIPEHWEVKRLKYLLTLINNKVESKNSQYRYIGMESVESNTGKLTEISSEVDGQASKFKKDHILFGKLRPYLAKVHLAKFDGISSTEFLIYETKSEVNNKFIAPLLLSDGFINTVNASTYGSKMPRASANFISNIVLAFPGIDEQKNITKFIEDSNLKINQAIDLQQQQIEKLKEYKTTLINSAVTGKIKVV